MPRPCHCAKLFAYGSTRPADEDDDHGEGRGGDVCSEAD